jgi:N utilization substance protein A
VKITNQEIKSISLFEQLTGAAVKDCIMDESRMVFIIKEGDLGRAIGKKGAVISRVRSIFNKQVEVFEYADTAEKFIRNLFSPVQITNLNIQGDGDKRIAYVNVDPMDRGAAIGRDGEKVKLARQLLQRHFNTDLKLY